MCCNFNELYCIAVKVFTSHFQWESERWIGKATPGYIPSEVKQCFYGYSV